MKDFGAPAQRVREGFRANGHGHKLLEVDVVVGVGASVDDVHHWNRQDVGIYSTKIAVER